MKKIFSTLVLLSAATPVLAHPGAHVHPHADSGVPLLLGLIVVAVAAFALWRAQ